MRKYQRRQKINKEIEAEDWCFLCKDGGKLIICDYGDCLKVYHPECVGKDESCSESGRRWTCDWHSCLMCHKIPKFHCFCCPNAVCAKCISSAEFVIVRSDNGFCNECLELVLLGEEDEAYNSDGEMIDFRDRETYEGLFKEYWEIIKEKEGLTMDDVYAASTQLKKSEHHQHSPISVKFGRSHEEDELIIFEGDEEDIENYKPLSKRKRSKKKEFIGWGSKSLIEFLKSIGKDTTKQLSHCEVDSIIKGYIQEKNLLDPENKRKVLCDERLYSVFQKKSLMKKKIFYFLESHFIENLEESDEDIDEYEMHLQNKHENIFVASKKQRSLSTGTESQEEEVDIIVKQSCFASIVVDNIKLVYLRRSLVEELFKQPETFEAKVAGSFIRIKTDIRDYLQKNSHQLLPVTGVEKNSTGKILLKVSSKPEDLHITMLSDSDFTEEECQDLREKMESGMLKKLTIGELEEKARSLHEDITKHWIKRELVLLQNRIDYANEKGRRRELAEYIDQRELLEKPSEQERLLRKEPKVIPEVVELKAASA